MSMADEFMEQLRSMAEALGLDEKESENFIDSGMERKGFRRISSWADPEPSDNDKSGDFFSRRRNEGGQRQRQIGGGQAYGGGR